jgi:REP element-mobilizing transposase RayT
MNLASIDRIWFLTWTTYGTWLPGDARGFVSPKFDGPIPERRNNEPGRSYDTGSRKLRRLAQSKLVGSPILLTCEQARVIRQQFEETAQHRGWRILAGAIMANHVHLVIGVAGDPDPKDLLRDFKSYASRALNGQFPRPESDTWWTERGSKRKVKGWENLETLLRYVREQPNALEVWEECGEEGRETRVGWFDSEEGPADEAVIDWAKVGEGDGR